MAAPTIINRETKDSGVRQEFSTGSQRDSRAGKGRYDLVSVFVEKRLAEVSERGAVKYGDRNWEKGQPMSRFYDSSRRHINQWVRGDRSEDHLGQALWNLGCMVHIEEMILLGRLPAELNDMPDYRPSTAFELVVAAAAPPEAGPEEGVVLPCTNPTESFITLCSTPDPTLAAALDKATWTTVIPTVQYKPTPEEQELLDQVPLP